MVRTRLGRRSWLFLALACIRFQQLQRSTWRQVTWNLAYAHCFQGKVRRQGVRQPYDWAVPRPLFLGEHPFDFLFDVHARLGHPAFLLPARCKARKMHPVRKWEAKPMPYVQIIEIMRQVFCDIGYTQDQAQMITFNTARRFLPTAASTLGFDSHTAQAIGSWMEVPQGQGTKGGAINLMSVHYSDEKALASGQAKQRVLDAFVAACSHHPAVQLILASRPAQVPLDQLTWEEVGAIHRQLQQVSQEASSSSAPVEAAGVLGSASRRLDESGRSRKRKKEEKRKGGKHSKEKKANKGEKRTKDKKIKH